VCKKGVFVADFRRKAFAVKDIQVKQDRPGWSGRNQRILWDHVLVVLECGHVVEKTESVFLRSKSGMFLCEYCRYGENQELLDETRRALMGYQNLMNGWVTAEEMRTRIEKTREVFGGGLQKGVVTAICNVE
jgi:hypothetical protein